MNENTKVALIGGTVSVIVALITAFAQTKWTFNNEKPGLVTDAAEQAADRIGQTVTGVPIGTIVSSMLSPQDFSELVGDVTNFDPAKCKWVPADGRSVAGSEYARIVTSTAPDLRGVFIRGLNYTEDDRNVREKKPEQADPERNRKRGSFQADALQQHGHLTDARQHGWDPPKPPDKKVQGWTMRGGEAPLANVKDVKPPGRTAVETRPKNVAAYFYIKVN